MTSEVSACSHSLVLLGGQSISSFTENSAGSIIADMLFYSVYDNLLTESRWHFAQRTKRLSKLAQKPDNDYSYKFQIPADCLYVVSCTANSFEIYQREIYCNDTDIKIDYVFRPGLDQCPAFFVKALEYKLASEFAVPLAGDEGLTTLYFKLAEQQLKKARYNDSSQRTNSIIEDSPYVSVRN